MSISNRLRYRRLLAGIVVVLLLGAGSFYAFNILIRKIPAPPGTCDMALADLDGYGDLDALLADERQAALYWNEAGGRFAFGGQRFRYLSR